VPNSGTRKRIRRDIADVVRRCGLVSVQELAAALAERDREVRGALELSIGTHVAAANVSNAFVDALRHARDGGHIEILVTPGGAFLLPGRDNRLGLFRAALLQRQLSRLPLLRPNAI
jgi:hypothetical protein